MFDKNINRVTKLLGIITYSFKTIVIVTTILIIMAMLCMIIDKL